MDFKTKGFIASLAVCGGILLGTTNANADTYTVQNGDTLSAVAQKTNTSVETLANINHIADVNKIAVGQKLETDYVETDEYVVQSGDTLSAIALKYGVSVEEIKNANGLSSDLLLVGQKLKVGGQLQPQVQPQVQTEAETQEQAQPQVQAQEQVQPQTEAQTEAQPQEQVQPQPQTQSQAQMQPQAQSQQPTLNDNEQSAKNWIAQKESNGSYSATNGQYIGKYQLSSSMLNGDYSPENQERVADNYVTQRYGSWQNAKEAWLANGWY